MLENILVCNLHTKMKRLLLPLLVVCLQCNFVDLETLPVSISEDNVHLVLNCIHRVWCPMALEPIILSLVRMTKFLKQWIVPRLR